MAIDHNIRNEILKYDINRKEAKYQLYHQVELIKVNIFQVEKYDLLIEEK